PSAETLRRVPLKGPGGAHWASRRGVLASWREAPSRSIGYFQRIHAAAPLTGRTESSSSDYLAPQDGLELTALRLTGNRVMVRSTIPTKSSRPLSPVALPAPAPSVNLVTPELLTAPADALHHHDEQDLAFVPSADPAHPPTIDA